MKRVAEVFSVRFCSEIWTSPKRVVDGIFGFALLGPGHKDRGAIIFKRASQDPPILREEPRGQVKLIGPEYGIQVKDELTIYSFLWSLVSGPQSNINCAGTLWRAGVDKTDQLICKEVETFFGPLEATFAIYSDGIEARFQVSLVDWNAVALDGVKAYGTVVASNSTIPANIGRSVLFDRPSPEESISVNKPPEEDKDDMTDLPLSRSVTVVPRESILFVDVSIWRLDSARMYTDASLIPISVKLCFDAKLTGGTQTQVSSCDCGNVQVTVTFSEL